MRQKGFALLPLIIIIALIGALGYFAYQNIQLRNNNTNSTTQSVTPTANLSKPSLTPDPTVNWKTYTNTKYGYTFKYPSSYYLMESSSESTSDVTPTSEDIRLLDTSKELVLMMTINFSKNDFLTYANDLFKDLSGLKFNETYGSRHNALGDIEDNSVVTSINKEYLNGTPAYSFTIKGNLLPGFNLPTNKPLTSKYLVVELNNNQYILLTNLNPDETSKNIFSTFKFTQ